MVAKTLALTQCILGLFPVHQKTLERRENGYIDGTSSCINAHVDDYGDDYSVHDPGSVQPPASAALSGTGGDGEPLTLQKQPIGPEGAK